MMEFIKFILRIVAVLMLPLGIIVGGWVEFDEITHPKIVLNHIKATLPEISDYSFYGFFIGLAIGFVIMVFAKSSNVSNKYGDAGFATKRMVKKMGLLSPKGIILGTAFNLYIRTNETLSCLLLAPPGTGKTAGFVIPNLFSCGNSMIIFDVKGELYRITSKRRSEFSKVLKFEPASPDSNQWNPLAKEMLPRDWAAKMVTIDRIADIIYPVNPEKYDHWITEGKSMFMFYAMFLVWKYGGTSIPEVRSFALSTTEAQVAIAEILEDHPDLEQRIIEEGNGLVQKPEKEFGSVFGTFKAKLNVFADPYVAKALNGNDFTFPEFRKSRVSLYLVVKAQDIGRLAPVVTLLFEMAAMYILSNEPKKEDENITLMIDEFARLGKMQQVLDMPALSRGNRGHAMLIAQDYAQIKRLYGNDGPDTLDGTCAYFNLFPQNNKDTAKNFSEKIGNKTVIRESESKNTKDGWNKNTSKSEEGIPLVNQQDFLSMPEWTSLILVQNHFKNPIKAKPVKWFEDPLMKNLAGCVDESFVADDDIEEKIAGSVPSVKIINNESLESERLAKNESGSPEIEPEKTGNSEKSEISTENLFEPASSDEGQSEATPEITAETQSDEAENQENNENSVEVGNSDSEISAISDKDLEEIEIVDLSAELDQVDKNLTENEEEDDKPSSATANLFS